MYKKHFSTYLRIFILSLICIIGNCALASAIARENDPMHFGLELKSESNKDFTLEDLKRCASLKGETLKKQKNKQEYYNLIRTNEFKEDIKFLSKTHGYVEGNLEPPDAEYVRKFRRSIVYIYELWLLENKFIRPEEGAVFNVGNARVTLQSSLHSYHKKDYYDPAGGEITSPIYRNSFMTGMKAISKLFNRIHNDPGLNALDGDSYLKHLSSSLQSEINHVYELVPWARGDWDDSYAPSGITYTEYLDMGQGAFNAPSYELLCDSRTQSLDLELLWEVAGINKNTKNETCSQLSGMDKEVCLQQEKWEIQRKESRLFPDFLGPCEQRKEPYRRYCLEQNLGVDSTILKNSEARYFPDFLGPCELRKEPYRTYCLEQSSRVDINILNNGEVRYLPDFLGPCELRKEPYRSECLKNMEQKEYGNSNELEKCIVRYCGRNTNADIDNITKMEEEEYLEMDRVLRDELLSVMEKALNSKSEKAYYNDEKKIAPENYENQWYDVTNSRDDSIHRNLKINSLHRSTEKDVSHKIGGAVDTDNLNKTPRERHDEAILFSKQKIAGKEGEIISLVEERTSDIGCPGICVEPNSAQEERAIQEFSEPTVKEMSNWGVARRNSLYSSGRLIQVYYDNKPNGTHLHTQVNKNRREGVYERLKARNNDSDKSIQFPNNSLERY